MLLLLSKRDGDRRSHVRAHGSSREEIACGRAPGSTPSSWSGTSYVRTNEDERASTTPSSSRNGALDERTCPRVEGREGGRKRRAKALASRVGRVERAAGVREADDHEIRTSGISSRGTNDLVDSATERIRSRTSRFQRVHATGLTSSSKKHPFASSQRDGTRSTPTKTQVGRTLRAKRRRESSKERQRR